MNSPSHRFTTTLPQNGAATCRLAKPGFPGWTHRSEEHTSELQSRLHLVCRLLLEKKKKTPEHPQYSFYGRHRLLLPDAPLYNIHNPPKMLERVFPTPVNALVVVLQSLLQLLLPAG